MNDTENSGNKTSTRKPGETLKDKIHRHLNDKNDIITEEDIRDAFADKKITENENVEIKKKKK
ncbi:MAG: hypothetical protein WDN26_13050 [Chitinophagaceae bacterium]